MPSTILVDPILQILSFCCPLLHFSTFLCTLNTLNNRSTAGSSSSRLGHCPPMQLQVSRPGTCLPPITHSQNIGTSSEYLVYLGQVPVRFPPPSITQAEDEEPALCKCERKTSTVEGFQVVSGPGVCCHGSAQVDRSRVKQTRCIALLPIHLLPSHP
ncbi:hypothetical protein CFIO01_12963 [Colletotrichum fioriniae PJ7]|uniref:Uncharacterized protein n=1 Tax=Colletotrichum fioriniae PJ7 TaxID=1445577 RepID=A0A010RJ78_9PEZI|nr:hypothetical protein CFIO01_12963 [Colletotrichum fioriniae PJ7]